MNRQSISDQILDVFKSEMKLNAITAQDSFFDLGGDSLMAENIVLALQREFDIVLETAVLLSAPSPDELALLIEEKTAPTTDFGKLISQQGNADALTTAIMVHGMSGSPLFASRLGAQFKAKAKILTLRGLGTVKGEYPLLDGNKIIEAYLTAIATKTTRPPEIFGGICIGALIAFDMARRSYERTGRKPKCILIDPPPIDADWLQQLDDETAAKNRRAKSRAKFTKYDRILKVLEALRLDGLAIARRFRLLRYKNALHYAFIDLQVPNFPCDVLMLSSSRGNFTTAQYTEKLPETCQIRSVVVEDRHKGFQYANRKLIDDEIARFLNQDYNYA